MTHLYISDNLRQRILCLRLDQDTGGLAVEQEVAIEGKIMPLALSPDGGWLYGAIRSQPWRIARLRVDPATFWLALEGYVAARDSLVHIATDPSGRWLLGACNPPKHPRRSGFLTVEALGPAGAITPGDTVLRTAPKLHSAVPDPAGRFVLAAVCDSDLILRLSLDPETGTLSQDGLTPVLLRPGTGPRHLRFHPDGHRLYAICEYDGAVYVFEYDNACGALRERQTASATPPGFKGRNVEASDIHLTPDGRFCYASVRESRTIAGFAVDPSTGTLTLIGHFPTADCPRAFAIDPSGRWLISAGERDGVIASHRIDPVTGALERVEDLAIGGSPQWVTFAA